MVLFAECPCCSRVIARAPDLHRWRLSLEGYDQGDYDCLSYAESPLSGFGAGSGFQPPTFRTCRTNSETNLPVIIQLTRSPVLLGLIDAGAGRKDGISFGVESSPLAFTGGLYGSVQTNYPYLSSTGVSVEVFFRPNTMLRPCFVGNGSAVCVNQRSPLKTSMTFTLIFRETEDNLFVSETGGATATHDIFFMSGCEDYTPTLPSDYAEPTPLSFAEAPGCYPAPEGVCQFIDSPVLLPSNVGFSMSLNGGIDLTYSGLSRNLPWQQVFGDQALRESRGDVVSSGLLYKKYACCLSDPTLNCNPLP